MSQQNSDARRRVSLVAILLAACAAIVGLRAVAVDFTSSRVRLVEGEIRPADGEVVSRTIPATNMELSVVVAQVRAGGQGATIEVRVGGRPVATAEVEAGRRRRIDAQVPLGLRAGDVIEVASPSSGWSVSYLEAANLHGFSNGILNAIIVPASRRDFLPLPWWSMAIAFVLLAVLWTSPRYGRHPRLETAVAAVGMLLFLIALVSPLVSRYAIVLAFPTFLLCTVLVFGASARRRYVALIAGVASSNSTAARRIDLLAAALTILVFYVAATSYGLAINKGNYTGFLYFGEQFASAPVLDEHPDVRASLAIYPSPYDAQYMFLMAFDPLLRKYEAGRYDQIVDSPPYRYGRIGFSWLTRLFSAGDPHAFARTMVWLILASHFAGGLFVAMIAADRGGSPWQALPYVLIPGFLVSLGRALPESIAAAFLLAGLWAHLRGRTWLAVAAWALSLLVRETGAILILVTIGWALLDARKRHQSVRLLVAFVPVAAWRLYVAVRLFPAFGWKALWSDPSDFTWPFAGMLQLLSANGAAHANGPAFNTWFPLLFVALFVLTLALFLARRTPVAAAALAYGLLAVLFNYEKVWLWVGNVERLTCELFLLVLVAALPFGTLPRGLRWSLAVFTLALFAYDFHAGTYATWFRSGLLVFR